jgi:hypothetical protein
MGDLVRTKFTLTAYPNGQTSIAYNVYTSFRPKGQGKGKLRLLLEDQFELPPDSTEVLLRPICESELRNPDHLQGTEAQWSSLP